MNAAGGTTSIVLVGVESTGKTTLARSLAETMGAPLVPEVARDWLAERGGRYEEADLETIARLQWRAELDARASATTVVVDTDLVVLRVWSEVRFGRCAAWIREQLARRPRACYLLPRPDLPWVPDPLRESPARAERLDLHERYRALLDELGHPWREVSGTGEARAEAVRDSIRAWTRDG